MKKIICTALFALFVFASSQAQDDRPVRIAFGVTPASTWIKPEGDVLTKESSGFGFSYGLIVDLAIAGNPNYAFSTGILVNSQGGSFLNSQFHDGRTEMIGDTSLLFNGFAKVEESLRLQYLDIPLTLKLKTNEIGYLTYFGQFGLDMSFNLKARSDINGNYEDGVAVDLSDENVSSEINPIRMALQVGAGAEYNISGDTYLMASVIWNNGLTNVFTNNRTGFISEEDADGTLRPAITENNVARTGDKFKAINNYLGLQIAVFF